MAIITTKVYARPALLRTLHATRRAGVRAAGGSGLGMKSIAYRDGYKYQLQEGYSLEISAIEERCCLIKIVFQN